MAKTFWRPFPNALLLLYKGRLNGWGKHVVGNLSLANPVSIEPRQLLSRAVPVVGLEPTRGFTLPGF